MGKSIYIITAYIPSDENIVVSDIKKIAKISSEGNCVIVSIKEETGIATGLSFPKGVYDNEVEALLSAINIGIREEEISCAGKMTFEEVLDKEKNIIEVLTKRLKV